MMYCYLPLPLRLATLSLLSYAVLSGLCCAVYWLCCAGLCCAGVSGVPIDPGAGERAGAAWPRLGGPHGKPLTLSLTHSLTHSYNGVCVPPLLVYVFHPAAATAMCMQEKRYLRRFICHLLWVFV